MARGVEHSLLASWFFSVAPAVSWRNDSAVIC